MISYILHEKSHLDILQGVVEEQTVTFHHTVMQKDPN